MACVQDLAGAQDTPSYFPKMHTIGNILPRSSPHVHCAPKSNCHGESIHPQTLVCSHPVFIQMEKNGPFIKTTHQGLTTFDAWCGRGVRAVWALDFPPTRTLLTLSISPRLASHFWRASSALSVLRAWRTRS